MEAAPGRSYPSRPLVGVGVVVWRGGEVLLVKRGREPRLGQWALPGGAQELGETLFACAIREVLEETGVTIFPQKVVTALDLIEHDAAGGVEGDPPPVRYHYTLVEIAAEYVSGTPQPGDDAADVAWFRPEQIEALNAWEEVARIVRLSAPPVSIDVCTQETDV